MVHNTANIIHVCFSCKHNKDLVQKRCAADARPISDLSDILNRFSCGCQLMLTNISQIIHDVCIHDLEEFIENV